MRNLPLLKMTDFIILAEHEEHEEHNQDLTYARAYARTHMRDDAGFMFRMFRKFRKPPFFKHLQDNEVPHRYRACSAPNLIEKSQL